MQKVFNRNYLHKLKKLLQTDKDVSIFDLIQTMIYG
jgi:hypothetical protein